MTDDLTLGWDGHDTQYRSVAELWQQELGNDQSRKEEWYGKSLEYWNKSDPSINGVLGGFPEVHEIDIQGTHNFILRFQKNPTVSDGTFALDCGAGIGRVTEALLSKIYTTTDLIEPCPHLIEEAKRRIPAERLGTCYLESLEKMSLLESRYDLILVQWVAIYFTDVDFVDFFARCKKALRQDNPNAIIIFKDNVASTEKFIFDRTDSSIIRTDSQYVALWDAAGLTQVDYALQEPWPQKLLPTWMIALK